MNLAFIWKFFTTGFVQFGNLLQCTWLTAFQILGGIYPIAQVQEPYSVIGYLAQRLDLPRLLRIKPVDEDMDEKTHRWSAMDICEGIQNIVHNIINNLVINTLLTLGDNIANCHACCEVKLQEMINLFLVLGLNLVIF